MVPALGANCVGVAHRIAVEQAERVLAELDFRERAGFERRNVTVVRDDATPIDAITYVADPDNEHFLGDAPLDVLAAEIATRVGPSGANRDYVFELARALRALGVERDHVYEVEAAVVAQLGAREAG